MSTKTLRKRIALVAVSALGFGLVSAAPSNAAVNAGLFAFVNKSTTVNVNSLGAVALSAMTSATAPGVSYTANGAIADSVATMTTPVSTVVAFKLTAGNAGTWSASTAARISTGGSTIGEYACTISTVTCTLANFTAPATAGTYPLTFTISGASTSYVAADVEVINITLVVTGASAQAVNQFPNSADATASTNGTLDGVKVSSVGIETVQVSGRTGIQVGFAPQYRLTRNGGATANDAGASNATKFATIAYSVANPAGTAVSVVSAQGGATASTSQAIAGSSTAIALGATNTTAVTQSISPTTGWPQKGSAVYFSAATAGTYTITAFHDANLDGLVSVGEATATSTVVIVADALPSITMTTYGNSLPADAAAGGNLAHLVKISLKNGTTPASLGLSEVLTITGPTNTVIDTKSERNANLKLAMVDAGDGVSVALTQANFDAAGNAYINIGVNAVGTHALSAVITGGTAAGAAGSGSLTVLDNALYPNTKFPDAALTYTNLTGVSGTGRAVSDAGSTYELTVKAATATTVAIGAKPGAGITAKAYQANLTDNYGLITGLVAGSYTLYKTVGTTATTADSVISWSVAVPALASTTPADAVKLEINVDDAGTAVTARFDISQALAVPTTSFSNPALTTASHTFRAGVASSNKMTVQIVDQFGNALPNISVNAAVAGRNSTTVIPTLLTDANGLVSYTLVDASTSTVLLTDTVTFTPASPGAAATVTINYATYLPAATITMTTPDSANATATGIAGQIKTDISSADGAEAGAVDVSVVLKDANGATLPSGIAVTFAVSGNAGAAILSTHKVGYTDASGKATTKVYAWLNGNATVTATAGSVSASGIVYFVQGSDGAEARTITAKADGNVVTAKVTDRFGNPIKGVTVTATRVGSGTFNGTSSITGITDAAGSVDFVLTNGTADVTVSLPLTGNYSLATKGYTNAGITALTAYTAGTVSIAEEGVGASFDAAGVNSATVNVSDSSVQSAADAAAEATDAANAATDAANAAAEAADAATAAAQDAADAVAALSTQVSEMVNALKKQITALTNLVIKSQKKVRA